MIAGGTAETFNLTLTNVVTGYSFTLTNVAASASAEIPAGTVDGPGAGTYTATVTIPTQTTESGGYRASITGDGNPGSFSISDSVLTVTGTPDFQITTLTYSAGTNYVGGTVIPMTLTYTNRSSSNSTPNVPYVPGVNGGTYFRVQVILSSNPVYGDADDFRLTFHDIAQKENANNAARTISWNQLLPGNFSGSYYVLAKIDALDAVSETIENDLTQNGNNIWLDVAATRIALQPSTFPTIYLASTTGITGGGTSGNGYSDNPSLTADGRYTAFASDATNLVTGDTNGVRDIFIFDSQNSLVRRLNLSQQGAQANGHSNNPGLSGNGRFVAFSSDATNLIVGDVNGFTDIFIVDTLTGAISLQSVTAAGAQGNGSSFRPSVSHTGRYIVFESSATNLVTGGTATGVTHIYLRDRDVGNTGTFDTPGNTNVTLIDVSGTTAGDASAVQAQISADGRYVTFASRATNLAAPASTAGRQHIYVRDVVAATTTRVSLGAGGVEANADSRNPSINRNTGVSAGVAADGRYVAFGSDATNLIAGDTNSVSDVFVYDLTNATTIRMSESTAGAQAIDPTVDTTTGSHLGSLNPSISATGRYVTFASLANNLAPGDSVGQYNAGGSGNGSLNIYVRDRDLSANGTYDSAGDVQTTNVSVNRFGYQSLRVLGTQSTAAADIFPVISADGRWVAFPFDAEGSSGLIHNATNLLSPDNNNARDVVLFDRRTNSLPNPATVPTVSITNPGAGGSALVNTAINVTASATTTTGVVSSVQFFVNGASLGTSNTFPYSATWTPTAVGNYTLSALVTDSFGNIGVSPNINVTINAAPSVGITSPVAGTPITSGTTQTITASAAASNPGATISGVQFFVNGTSLGAADTTSPYTASWTPNAAGTYTLTVVATDTLGTQTTSPAVSITVNAPSGGGGGGSGPTPPVVNVVTPANGATVTVNQPQTVTASATATGGTVSSVEFFANGTSIGAASTFPYQVVWTPTTPGSYAITATATDNNGTKATSTANAVTVATGTPPTVSITTPTSGAILAVNTPQTVTASAVATGGTVTNVEFFANGVAIGAATAFPFSVSWTPTAPGAYALTAVVTDSNGSQVTSGVNSVSVITGTPPTISIVSPTSGSSGMPGTAQTISANVAPGSGSIVSVAFFANGITIGTDPTFPYNQVWTPAGPGTFALTAVATDTLGNQTTSAPVSVTIAGNLPPPPVVAITTPATNTTVLVNTTQNITATASSTGGTIDSVEFFANGQSVGVDNSFPYGISWNPTALGNVTITAVATDNFGSQTTSAAIVLTVAAGSSTLPTVFLTSTPNATSVAQSTPVAISASAEDPDGEVTSVEFLVNGQVVGSKDTAPYFTLWTPTTAGAQTVTAVVTDNAGNRVTSSPAIINVQPRVGVVPVTALTFNDPAVDTPTGTAPPAPKPLFTPSPVSYGSKLLLSADAVDQDGSIATVQFFANGTSIGTVAAAPYLMVWDLNTLSDVVLTAIVTDSAGNSVYTNPILIETQPSTTAAAGTVTLNSPLDGSTYVTGGQVLFAASHNFGSVTPPKIDFYLNGDQFATVSAPPYQTILGISRAGIYQVHAVVRSGTQTTVSSAARITVTSNTAPIVAISSPATGSAFIVGVGTTIAATASDPDGTIQNVQFLVNGTALSSDTTTPYTAAWNPGAAGIYTLTALATDNAGNQSLSAPVVVRLTGNTAPSVVIASPASGSVANAGTGIVLNANATDSDGNVASVRFLANGVAVGSATAAPFSTTWTPSAPGTYTVVAEATDNSGNVVSSQPITVEVSANRGPAVALTAPANGSTVRVGAGATITATATDPDGTIVSVQFAANGAPIGSPDTTPPYTTQWTPTAEGIYRLTATALDNSGASMTTNGITVLAVAAGAGDIVYSGSYAGAGEMGRFALINVGGRTAAFIGFSSTTPVRTYFFPSLPLDVSGGFSSFDATGRSQITGSANDTGVSGTLDNGRITFIGPIAFATGTSGVPAGYYTGNLSGRMGSTLSAIVAPDGGITVVATDGTFRDAGSGTVNSTGAFAITTASGNRLTGRIEPTSGFLTGDLNGGPGGSFTAALSSGVSFSDGFLRNLSTRGQVGTGANILIAGFVVGGNQPKQVLVRAIGPSLSQFGVTGGLADTQLQVFNGNTLVATNDNWAGDPVLVNVSNQAGAFPLSPSSLDSVLSLTLAPGTYTAQVSGIGGRTGVALVELYDVDNLSPFSTQKVLNVATRGVVGTGQAQLIAGFVVSGNTPKKILVRGVGPTLGNPPFNVPGVLADPVLSIVRSDGLVVRENDNWESGNDPRLITDASGRVGAFALAGGSRDAAILISLPPGTYTAQVTGPGNTTGVGLIEVYEVP